MIIEFATSGNSNIYKNVSKISIKGNLIYMYYTDNKTYQEYLDRVDVRKLKYFNVLEVKWARI